MSGLPVGDPQFWAVTLVAVASLVWLVRSLRAGRSSPKRVGLTIEGRARPSRP